MKFIKSIFKKAIDAIKVQPVVTAGGLLGAGAAVITWAQTNQITTVRQLLTFGLPVAIGFVVHTFVTPNSKVALTVDQVAALQALIQPAGQNVNTGTPPNTPAA